MLVHIRDISLKNNWEELDESTKIFKNKQTIEMIVNVYHKKEY